MMVWENVKGRETKQREMPKKQSRERILLPLTSDRDKKCEESRLMTGKLWNAWLDIQ